MRDQIVKGKKFSILSKKVDNATFCTISNVFEDCFEVELEQDKKYEIDETIELFSMTNKGQLYFETIVKGINGRTLQIWYPITYKYLQRREYSRIVVDKDIILKDSKNSIKAKIVDISPGGIKVITPSQLNLLNQYEINIVLDSNTINCKFEPIRMEYFEGEFVSSGRFSSISNYDRITLFQYCCGKQIEISNK
ncbi:PilZ domain-containing protein [bacterium]|nr:PilZ domain-containing protein [bacterium]